MAKIDQEIKDLRNEVSALSGKIDRLQFQLVQILNKINDEGSGITGGSSPIAPTGAVSVDITPLEERLEQLSKSMVSKADLESITQELAQLKGERLKEAEESIDNVTVLLEKGLALTELTASLKAIEAHLLELVSPPK
jgi:hypothetical protein